MDRLNFFQIFYYEGDNRIIASAIILSFNCLGFSTNIIILFITVNTQFKDMKFLGTVFWLTGFWNSPIWDKIMEVENFDTKISKRLCCRSRIKIIIM